MNYWSIKNQWHRLCGRQIWRCTLALFIFSSLLLTACESPPAPSSIDEGPKHTALKYIAYLEPDQKADGVLVKFKANTSGNSRARSLAAAGLSERSQFRLVPGLSLSNVAAGLDINSTLNALAADPLVAYAEPNYIYTIDVVPNDTSFSQQWGLNNGNNTDINAPEAWDVGTGSNTVVIAVIDSGVDYNHPDLRNNIWSNPGEIAGNGVDDDGNGFRDDVRGWDFEANDNNPMDENNHGTHVAGIIGAQTNNGTGVAGTNWNVQIMPLKFMNPQGAGTTAAAINALDYAVRMGADVSNNSWGGGSFSQALFDAIQRANAQGHLFVAASGNDGVNNDNTPHYPSSYNLANIISVAASDQNGGLTGFSNFGINSVDLAAPGAQILSTTRNGGYQAFSGTSMAAPFVSGVAGLLLGQNPNLSVSELRNFILNNVTNVGALSGRVATGGRLNAFASISAVPSAAPGNPPTNPTPVELTSPGISTLNVGDTLQLNVTGGDGNYTWRTNAPNIISITNNGLLRGVSQGSARVTVRDGQGIVSNALVFTITAAAVVAPISISPADVTQMDLGASIPFSVGGGAAPYNWSVSNAAVATVIPSGASGLNATVTADQIGQFSISVADSSGATTTSAVISVIGSAALNVNPPRSSLNIGETAQLTASGGTSPYTWSTTNNRVVSVDNGGLVTAVGQGVASVTVQDSASIRATVNIDVTNNTGGPLVISPSNSAISIGASTRLKATGGGLTLTWASSDPTVATIDNRGVVKALAAGLTVISVTDENGNRGETNLEVRELSITASVFTIGAGDTLQMSATGGTAPYTWSVNNASLANIDQNGLLSSNTGSTGGLLVTATDTDNIEKSVIVTINNSTTLRAPQAR